MKLSNKVLLMTSYRSLLITLLFDIISMLLLIKKFLL